MTTMRRDTDTASSPDTDTASSPLDSGCATAPPGLYRYHATANLVLCVGVVTGMVSYAMGWLPPWGGFLVGAVPAFILAAIAHTLRDE